MWERGLKQAKPTPPHLQLAVAPHVGAWIETGTEVATIDTLASLPMWERGLKLHQRTDSHDVTESLPMWERGLKLNVRYSVLGDLRRSPCGSVD